MIKRKPLGDISNHHRKQASPVKDPLKSTSKVKHSPKKIPSAVSVIPYEEENESKLNTPPLSGLSFSFKPKTGQLIIGGEEIAAEEVKQHIKSKTLVQTEAPVVQYPKPLTGEEKKIISEMVGISPEMVEMAGITFADANRYISSGNVDHLKVAEQVAGNIMTGIDLLTTAREYAATSQNSLKRAEASAAQTRSTFHASERELQKTKQLIEEHKEQLPKFSARIQQSVEHVQSIAFNAAEIQKSFEQESQQVLARVSIYHENMQRMLQTNRTESSNNQRNVDLKTGIIESMRDQTARTYEQMSELFASSQITAATQHVQLRLQAQEIERLNEQARLEREEFARLRDEMRDAAEESKRLARQVQERAAEIENKAAEPTVQQAILTQYRAMMAPHIRHGENLTDSEVLNIKGILDRNGNDLRRSASEFTKRYPNLRCKFVKA